MLHEKDGTVKARCECCHALYAPEPRELAAIERDPLHYARICAVCLAESIAWAKKIGNIPTRRRKKA